MDQLVVNNIDSSGSSLENQLFDKSVNVSGSSMIFTKNKKELLHFYIDYFNWPIVLNYGIYKGVCNCYLKKNCNNPGKHPRSKLNPITEKNEVLITKDKNQLDEWLKPVKDNFNQYSNFATKCGKESGIIAFDIDPRHGGKRDAFNFPPTLEYRTPGGGWRLLYNDPDFEIEGNPNFGEGIELITNGYITLPPSQGISGINYQWINNLPIADISKEFIESGNKPNNKNNSGGYKLPDEIEEGDRDINAYKFACSLRARGLEEDEILAVLLSVNDKRFNPPLEERQLIEKAQSACKNEKGKDYYGIYEDIPIKNNNEKFKLGSMQDAYEFIEPITFVIDKLVEAGTYNVYYGAYGSKKTYALIDMAVCIANGKDWCGLHTIQSPVIWIDEESGNKGLKRRMKRANIGENGKEDCPFYFISKAGFNLYKYPKEHMDILKEFILEKKAKVVFFDAFKDIMRGGDENSTKDTELVSSALDDLAKELDITVIAIHHANARGSIKGNTAIPQTADVSIKVESVEGETLISFISEKMRNAEPIKIYTKIHFDGIDGPYYMEESETPFDNKKPNNAEQAVIDYLKQNGSMVREKFLDTAPDEKIKIKWENAINTLLRNKVIEHLGEVKRGFTQLKLSEL